MIYSYIAKHRRIILTHTSFAFLHLPVIKQLSTVIINIHPRAKVIFTYCRNYQRHCYYLASPTVVILQANYTMRICGCKGQGGYSPHCHSEGIPMSITIQTHMYLHALLKLLCVWLTVQKVIIYYLFTYRQYST